MSIDYRSAESILALDCGSTTTKASLIDRVSGPEYVSGESEERRGEHQYVSGEYRLVARCEVASTVEPPWIDVTAGVRQALARLSAVTGRPLLDTRGQIMMPENQAGGVDAVVAVTSAAEPLRLVVAGVVGDVSLASARRALTSAYAVIDGIVSLDAPDGDRHAANADLESQVRLIHDLAPDAIVLVGGVDGGATRPVLDSAEAVAIACSTLSKGECPPTIYAGNTELRERVAAIMAGTAESWVSIDNVRPSLESENLAPLRAEIEKLFRVQKMERVPGYGTLAAWSPVQVVPAAKGFADSVRYLAAAGAINVLGVDAGGASTTVAAVIDGDLDLSVRSDLGLSYNVTELLDHVPVEAIKRWLPFEIDTGELLNALYNKAYRYRTVPQTRQDLLLEQAIAREALALAVNDLSQRWPASARHPYDGLLPKFHLIVGAGGVLAHAPNYGQAVLVLLDALQPTGVSGLAIDSLSLLPSLGATALVNPLAAAQVMDRDALLSLGTVVAPVGTAREGDIALTFKIQYEDGRSLEVEVPYGSLEVIPLPVGQTANLELRPTRRFDVGLGTRGQAGKTRVEGGVIGIIIDARGRPLPIAQDLDEQRAKMQRWLWDVGS